MARTKICLRRKPAAAPYTGKSKLRPVIRWEGYVDLGMLDHVRKRSYGRLRKLIADEVEPALMAYEEACRELRRKIEEVCEKDEKRCI